MKTVRIIVDVDKGELQVRAQNDEVTFHLFDGLKILMQGRNVYKMMQQRGLSTLR